MYKYIHIHVSVSVSVSVSVDVRQSTGGHNQMIARSSSHSRGRTNRLVV